MASKDEIEPYKDMFAAEDDRAKLLTSTGQIYIGLTGTFLGYLGYKATDTQFAALRSLVSADGAHYGVALFVLVFALILGSLILTFCSMLLHSYRRLTDPSHLRDAALDGLWTAEETNDVLIACYIESANVNWAINNGRVRWLEAGSWCLLAGLVLYGIGFLVMT